MWIKAKSSHDMKRSSILFVCVFLFNLNTFSQSIFISDLVLENSIDIEHVSIQNKKVTIQSQKDLILSSKLIESYINQGFEVVIKSKKDIVVSASLSFITQSKNQFVLECEDKGQILFRSFSGIASQNQLLNLTVKTKGDIIVKENAVLSTNGGEIRLQAFEETKRLKKNATNKIEVFGTLNASSKLKGGKIIIESDDIHLSSHSKVLAQGNLGGGVILIGGDWQGGKEKTKKESEDIYEAISVNMEQGALIDASALSHGNGGKVVLWSNLHHPRSNTKAKGQILAMSHGRGKGGFIETSGGAVDFEKIKVSTIASDGSAGEWLIDPWNFVFNASQLSSLATNLNSNNITISTANSSITNGTSPSVFFGSGHIVFQDPLTYSGSTARTLTLNSNEDIWINSNISSSSGALSLVFNAPSAKRVLINGDISTNGGSITVNNAATVHFQKTSGTQTINSNGGAINFGNSNIRLLRHSGTLSINSGSGQFDLGGSGSVEQVNTFFNISATNLWSGWGGTHVNSSKTYGITVTSGLEYSTRLYFWDSWDNERGELVVVENGTWRYYFTAHRTHGATTEMTNIVADYGTQYQINGPSAEGRGSWNDIYVDITFVAQHTGTLTTWNNLNQADSDESLEIFNFWQTSFPTTSYSSGSRSLELISTSGQLACGTKSFSDLASITFNTNNDWCFVDGIISGATNVTKSGTGRVRFSGRNTYSGTTAVNAGTYRFAPWFTSNVALSGAFTNNGIVTYETGNENNRATIYLDGGISGSGTWNISSDVAPANIWSNRLSFRSTTTTSGQINISSHGNLWLEGSNINMTSPIFLDGSNARLRLYGNNTMTVGQITGTGTVDFADGAGGQNITLAINTGSSNHQFGGIFANSGTSSGPTVLNIRKNGAGTYTLTGNNTYTGTTAINAGVLQIGNGGATGRLGSGAVTVATNSTLNFNLNAATSFNNGFNFTAAGATIANTSTTSGAMMTLSGGVNAGTSGSSILDGGTAGITLSGAATPAGSGAGVWTKGDVTFTGSDLNTLVILSVGTGSTMRFKTNATTWFFGSTTAANAPNVMVDPNITLSQNTVQAAGNLFYNNLSGTGTISLAGSGATHSILGESSVSNLNATSSIGLVVGQGGSTGSITSGTITANNGITLNSTSSYVFSGVLSGTTLTKQNTNTVTLTGTNTYSGAATISGGTLQIGNNGTTGSIGSGSIVNNGTLSINRSDNITLANAISGTGIVNKLNNTTATFTANNSYSGATNITGTLVLQNNAPTSSSSSYQGSGQLRIESAGNDFTSAFSTSGWTFGSALSGLTIGKSTNTANVTLGSTTTIAGPVTVNGGNITVNENLSTTNNGSIMLDAETGSQLTFNGNGITLATSKSIAAHGTGTVTILGRGGNTSALFQCGVQLGAGTSVTTGGGNITIDGRGGNSGGDSHYGVQFAQGTNINIASNGGNISISGQGDGSGNNNDGINFQNTTILAGSGSIILDGKSKDDGLNSESLSFGTNNMAFGGATQTGNIIFRGDHVWSGGPATKTAQTSGTLTFEPFSNSFSSTQTYPFDVFTISSITGLNLGKSANTAGITIGSAAAVAGPVNVYGGTLTFNENLSSTVGGNISLYGNTLTFALGKTISSVGELLVAPQSANSSIGLAGATGTLQVTSTHFSTNFTDGFSNIQIGSNDQTGAISANAFTLRDHLTVLTTGSLTLGGKPILGNNNVTLGSAISSISGTPTHYFQTNGSGTVRRNIANNINFSFPIGNAMYNPISIQNKTGNSDLFAARVIDSASLNGVSGTLVATPHVKATWDISKTNANTGSGIDMTFSWNSSQEVGGISNFKLNHHDGSGWKIAAGTTGTVSGTTTKTITHTGYTGSFSPFAFGNSGTPLPVELIAFNAQCMNEYIQIDWTTASEKNNKMFELYKSDNAIDWSLIHTADGQGDKASETNYQFMDYKKQPAYYRLKDIDFDGIENWSPIIFEDCKSNAAKTEIYPNPASDYIKVNAEIDEKTTLRIVSLDGRILKTLPLVSKQTLVDIKTFVSGVYIIEIINQKSTTTFKIYKL